MTLLAPPPGAPAPRRPGAPAPRRPALVVATPAGDRHELAAMLVGAAAAEAG